MSGKIYEFASAVKGLCEVSRWKVEKVDSLAKELIAEFFELREKLNKAEGKLAEKQNELQARLKATVDGTDCIFCGLPTIQGIRCHDAMCPWNERNIEWKERAERAEAKVKELQGSLNSAYEVNKTLLTTHSPEGNKVYTLTDGETLKNKEKP